MIGLINDILDVEKLEAGKLDMELVDVAVPLSLKESEQAVNTFAAANNGVLLDMKLVAKWFMLTAIDWCRYWLT